MTTPNFFPKFYTPKIFNPPQTFHIYRGVGDIILIPPIFQSCTVVPPYGYGEFFLFHCAMIDRLKKLVAVAEDMVTELHEMEESVEGIDVSIECNVGVIRLGRMREYAVYCPDENQYEPNYAMDYTIDRCYDWIDNAWVRRVPEIVKYERNFDPFVTTDPFAFVDELPF